MQAKGFAIAGIFVFVMLFAGCAGSGGGGSTANQVEAKGLLFKPQELTVKVGAKVTWVNRDSYEHTVTPDNVSAEFGGKSLAGAGETYTVTFAKAGTFKYHCIPHKDAGMTGTITVTA